VSVFLLFLSLPVVGAGVIFVVYAQSAIHEIEALHSFLIGAVCLVGVAIVEAIRTQQK
jgi:hypothetical protein